MATPRLTSGQVTEGISAKPRCWTATSTVAATAGERQLPQLPDGTALPHIGRATHKTRRHPGRARSKGPHHSTTRCSPIPTGFSEHRVAARVPGLGNGPHARTARRATGRHSFTGVYPCGIPAFATVPPCLRGLLARLDSHASLHLPPRCRGSGPPEEGPPTIRNG